MTGHIFLLFLSFLQLSPPPLQAWILVSPFLTSSACISEAVEQAVKLESLSAVLLSLLPQWSLMLGNSLERRRFDSHKLIISNVDGLVEEGFDLDVTLRWCLWFSSEASCETSFSWMAADKFLQVKKQLLSVRQGK